MCNHVRSWTTQLSRALFSHRFLPVLYMRRLTVNEADVPNQNNPSQPVRALV